MEVEKSKTHATQSAAPSASPGPGTSNNPSFPTNSKTELIAALDGGGPGEVIQVLNEDGKQMRMLLDGVDLTFANAWRRAIMSEVEVMSIDRLEIHQSSTMMHDENLLHRLGLIPLKCAGPDLDHFLTRYECDCDDGCPRCTAEFRLDVTNNSDETIEVTTNDLKPCQPHVRTVSGDILLVKLHKNQRLSFTAYAVKSTSRYENNAKWNATTIACYRPTARITVDSDLMNRYLTPDEQKRICKAEPAQVLVYNEQLKRTEAHPDAPLRATYTGDFIEQLADILHPPTHPSGSAPVAPPTNSGANPTLPTNSGANRIDEKHGKDRETAISDLEAQLGRVMRHPTELVHPMISMVPRTDQFLFPIISTGCLPPREIALRGLAAIRKRLVAIQMLIRRRKNLASHH